MQFAQTRLLDFVEHGTTPSKRGWGNTRERSSGAAAQSGSQFALPSGCACDLKIKENFQFDEFSAVFFCTDSHRHFAESSPVGGNRLI
jgi:hypothetical protein